MHFVSVILSMGELFLAFSFYIRVICTSPVESHAALWFGNWASILFDWWSHVESKLWCSLSSSFFLFIYLYFGWHLMTFFTYLTLEMAWNERDMGNDMKRRSPEPGMLWSLHLSPHRRFNIKCSWKKCKKKKQLNGSIIMLFEKGILYSEDVHLLYSHICLSFGFLPSTTLVLTAPSAPSLHPYNNKKRLFP